MAKIIIVPQCGWAEINPSTHTEYVGLYTTNLHTCAGVILTLKMVDYCLMCHANGSADLLDRTYGAPHWLSSITNILIQQPKGEKPLLSIHYNSVPFIEPQILAIEKMCTDAGLNVKKDEKKAPYTHADVYVSRETQEIQFGEDHWIPEKSAKPRVDGYEEVEADDTILNLLYDIHEQSASNIFAPIENRSEFSSYAHFFESSHAEDYIRSAYPPVCIFNGVKFFTRDEVCKEYPALANASLSDYSTCP